jgi:hypothetical protein
MKRTLEQRLGQAKDQLSKVEQAFVEYPGRVPAEVESQFRVVTSSAIDIDHWVELIKARAAALGLLLQLENQADADDTIMFGTIRAKYQHIRLIGVQAYLSTTWALADRIIGTVGRVLCTPEAAFDPGRPAQLVTQFLQKDRKKNTAGAIYESVRQTFGWPIALSYSLRNHFIHDGARLPGFDFFEGSNSASRFAISRDGWAYIEERARGYGVDPSYHRVIPSWPVAPSDDLRAVLKVCESELDDALGVLIGSACGALLSHVAFVVGEDY